MNKVILMGRLVKDPEVRYSKSETPIAITHYSLAVPTYYGKNSKDDTLFIDVVAFGNSGEFASKYFTKGKMIIVEGKLHKGSWEDAEHVKHWKIEVIAERQDFADGYSKQNNRDSALGDTVQATEGEIAIAKTSNEKISADDLPF